MAEEVQILQVITFEDYHDNAGDEGGGDGGDGDGGTGYGGDNGSDDELIFIKRSFDTPAS